MTVRHTIASPGNINVQRYGRLLAKYVPKVIETKTENDAALAIIETLMSKGDNGRSHEEEALLELLLNLVEQFETTEYHLPESTPLDALKYLMESNSLKASDLTTEFGYRGRVSDVLSGRRNISKEQARRLGERFRVSTGLFI